MKIKTSSGFECEIPSGLSNDYRFLRARMDLRSSDPEKANKAAMDLVPLVFCDEKEEERFLRHLADKNGRAMLADVYREIGEILAQAREQDAKTKNS